MKRLLSITILLLILFNSCQSEKSDQPNVDGSFIISNLWIRPGVVNRNTAAFMRITNNTEIDDTLFTASSDLAKVVEIHETYTRDNDMKGMRHVDYLIIPHKSSIELKPGSFHIMLIGLNNDLYKDDSVKLTLSFKISGNIEIETKVK